MALTLGRLSVNNGFRNSIHHMTLNSMKRQRCYSIISKEERKSADPGNVKVLAEVPVFVSRGQCKLERKEVNLFS